MHSQIKIHRFDSEKTSSPTSLAQLPRSMSVSLMLGGSQKVSNVPEEDVNSSVALRKLKQINDSKEMLRGRLSVLQIQDQKQEWRTLSHQQKFAFLQRKRQQAEQIRQAKAVLALARQRQNQEAQENARKERALRKESLMNVRKELSKAKAEDYREVKQRRGEIEKSIQQARREEAIIKKIQQEKVRQYERSQRTSVSRYRQNKVVEIREGDTKEAKVLSRMRAEQALQVKELQKLQLLMIHKQTNSRMKSQRSQIKLKEMIGKGKQGGSSISLGKKRISQKEILVV